MIQWQVDAAERDGRQLFAVRVPEHRVRHHDDRSPEHLGQREHVNALETLVDLLVGAGADRVAEGK